MAQKAARIREESPILRVTSEGFPSFWAVTTHTDVLEIERHPEIVTNSPAPVLTQLGRGLDTEGPAVKTLIEMDGEEHRSHRAVVNDWFKPGGVKKLSSKVDQLASESWIACRP